LDRKFAFERFERLDIAHLEAVKKEALEKIYAPEPGKYTIVGTDIDPEMADIATGNAEKAGVAGIVRFEKKDLADYKSIE
jgi:23S rRNA G2445 N2-methylase RlmL